MGVYLNSRTAYTLYKDEAEKPYFVDKSQMLEELFPYVNNGNHHICITRPRRFGKTVNANMIVAFFSEGCAADDLFCTLKIAENRKYKDYLNQYSVVNISFNELPRRCSSYEEYIDRIEKRLIRDLQREYPDVEITEKEAVWDILTDIYTEDERARFIFYPETDKNADCMILELKVDSTPTEAIRQIKDRNYALRFRARAGELPRYSGRILAVGISYDKTAKKHQCKVEILTD